ncbi:hypothetical protein [Amycolatopsis sp. NPDC051061]|uniref:hypothetical protein n=1 Tax=Amycolatopsis sp. NPDC051061 TaxID=3155042 RepID=UPI003438F245
MNSSVPQPTDGFVTDRRGPHLLIRRADETELPGGAVGWPAPLPGDVFVLVSAAAAQDESLVTLLPSVLHREVAVGGDVRSVRIGLPGLAADPLVPQALADVLHMAVFAPEGDFTAQPGAALYASGGGWLRFCPGAVPAPAGRRHPLPRWESSVPAEPVAEGDVVLEPVPAGVLVRDGHAQRAAGGPAFAVPVDPQVMRIVVGAGGRVPEPAAAAAAVRSLDVPVQLMVLPSPARTHSWLREFAKVLARDVVVVAASAAGRGTDCFAPFASTLRQRADGGQEVLEAISPLRGWHRRDRTGYRFGDVSADVVPSGLALRTGAADPAAARSPFDPGNWTLHLGTPGEPIAPEVLTAAEALLGELDPRLRTTARLRLAGTLDDRARELLGELPGRPAAARAPSAPGRPGASAPPAGRRRPAPASAQGPAVTRGPGSERDVAMASGPASAQAPAVTRGPGSAHTPGLASVQGPAVTRGPAPAQGPIMPPSALVTGPPIPTVSGAPGPAAANAPAAPAEAVPSAPRPPHEAAASASVESATAEFGTGARRPAGARPKPPAGAEPVPDVPAPAASSEAAAPPARPAVLTGKELVVKDRASTAAEQARFTTAAGEAYGEALATVNAALATWPSMRHEEPGAKADFVAVCLYLGRGAGGSAELGAAVRAGSGGELEGQVPCLVSGLRRLPTHRRAVLRQGRAGQSPEGAAEPGAVLTEPGFLVGSTDLDVTVPDAGLDILIWPASARRTSELRIGHPVNEVVFFAGARFKALAVRTAEPVEDPEDGALAAPRTAALFRELAPGEQVSATGELDDQDLAALAKLDQALERRHRSALRVVDEPEVLERITTSLLEWRAEAASRAQAGNTITLAS